MIYHVTTKDAWEKASAAGEYIADTIATEGFMHASYAHQLKGVLERYYQGKKDLILLHIDESKLLSPLKIELAPSVNEDFPHVYGPVNINAVTHAEEIPNA